MDPPLGVEVIWEFQEFQNTKTRCENQKTKNDRWSCIHSVSNLVSSYSIDLVPQMFNFPHLSIHQEVTNVHQVEVLSFKRSAKTLLVEGRGL